MLSVDSISVQLREKLVLDSLSFHIAKGEVVGLAGASGAGKSTLLRCIQGLEKPQSGTITVEGEVGFLFQDFQLFPHLTVLENIIYTPNLLKKKTKNEVEEDAIKILTSLGLVEVLHIYPEELSGGQKQRVALARALILSPNLLLCDEPTSGLDVNSIHDVISLLQSISSTGVSLFISSHDISFLHRICTRIIVISQGKIALNSAMNILSEKDISLYY